MLMSLGNPLLKHSNKIESIRVYTSLCDLNGDRDDWVICVKVHHVWHQTYKNTPTQVSSKEMILLDCQGNKIHASVKKSLLHDFEESLEEGNHIELSNFGVGSHGGKYMVVDHQYKVNFIAHFELLATRISSSRCSNIYIL